MLAGFRDGGDHAGSFHRLQLLELIVEGAIPLGRHRHFFHCVVSFLLRPKTGERRSGTAAATGALRDRPKKVGRPTPKLKMADRRHSAWRKRAAPIQPPFTALWSERAGRRAGDPG